MVTKRFNVILLILCICCVALYTNYGTFTVSEEDPVDIEDIEVYHPPLSESIWLADTNKDHQAIYSQLKPVQWYKDNWKEKADCPYPSYVHKKYEKLSWFPLFLHHQMKVNLSAIPPKQYKEGCTRFWHAQPQTDFGELPHRKLTWKEQKPPPNYVRPNCSFGQGTKPWTRCSRKHQELWSLLDQSGIIYFARSGSELGVIRNGTYLSHDGDMDVYVDYPPEKFIKLIGNQLTPRPYGDRSIGSVKAETHWDVPGCPKLNMVFNDWMVNQMAFTKPLPTHKDLCTCYLQASKMACHKDAKERMFVHYGPSWFVPLNAKYGDMPWRARGTTIQTKLAKMASRDGIIYEEAVRKLDPKLQYTKYDMEMTLAQNNVLHASIVTKYSTCVHGSFC